MGHSVHCRMPTHTFFVAVSAVVSEVHLIALQCFTPPPTTPDPLVLVFLQQFVLKDSLRSLFVAVCLQKYWHVSDVSAVMHTQVQWSPLETAWLELLPPDSNMSVSTCSLPVGHPNAIQLDCKVSRLLHTECVSVPNRLAHTFTPVIKRQLHYNINNNKNYDDLVEVCHSFAYAQ